MSTAAEQLKVKCKHCGRDNVFDQPYAYHAGFGNQGFLYDDAGTLTLTWSSFDPAYEAVVGQKHPWALAQSDRDKLEARLRDAPSGGRWRFCNPARCVQCRGQISDSILQTIYFLLYPGSIETQDGPKMQLREYLNDDA
jgi:hypothetical protein